MKNNPRTKEMKEQIQKFGDLLFSIKKLQKAARAAGLPARQLDIDQIDKLLEEFEEELKEFAKLQKEWEAKQTDLQALEKESARLLDEAKKIEIKNQDDFERAQSHLAELKRHENLIHAKFAPFTTAYDQQYNRLLKLQNRLLAECRLENE